MYVCLSSCFWLSLIALSRGVPGIPTFHDGLHSSRFPDQKAVSASTCSLNGSKPCADNCAARFVLASMIARLQSRRICNVGAYKFHSSPVPRRWTRNGNMNFWSSDCVDFTGVVGIENWETFPEPLEEVRAF